MTAGSDDAADPAAIDGTNDVATVDRRFGGIVQSYGVDGLARLRGARVAVAGLGGVGSWVVEALARSGVGRLTLIDLDHVSESNINRQSHALDSTVGAAKAAVMAARVADIDPRCDVDAIEDFVDASNAPRLLPAGRFDFVVDATDDVRAKVALIAHARMTRTAVVTVGGAGGRTDPSRVRLADLAFTRHEPMLAKVRRTLRAQHGFPRDGGPPGDARFGVAAVFFDHPMPADAPDGVGHTRLHCGGLGSVVAVTAVFGFVAAGHVVDRLARGGRDRPAGA